MNPKEKSEQLISDFTSICLMSYHYGGGKGCTCDECHSYGLKRIMDLGRDAALKTAQEILEQIPAIELVEGHEHIGIPSEKMIYWQRVIEEIEK